MDMMEANPVVNFDEVFLAIGEFGVYQKFIVSFLILSQTLLVSFVWFGPVFIFFSPQHSCVLSDQYVQAYNQSEFIWEESSCSASIYTNQIDSNKSSMNPLVSSKECASWSYDSSVLFDTAVTKWDLVCDKKYLVSLLISLGAALATVGGAVFGWIQDRCGRKKTLYLNISIFTFCCLASAFVDSLALFAIFRCTAALTSIAACNLGYLYSLEFVGPSKRSLVSTLFYLIYAVTAMALGGLAYLFRNNFRGLLLATSAPFVVLFAFYPFILESPRWLFTQGKYDEARNVLKVMQKWEGKKNNDAKLDKILGIKENGFLLLTSQRYYDNPVSLLEARSLRIIVLIITYACVANALTYYAIAFNIENIGGNFFITYVIQAGVEAPAVLLNLYLLERSGRIRPLASSMLMAGVCALLTALYQFMPLMLTISFAMVSKFGICMSYAIIYQVASELFPTECRGMLLGFSTVIANIGNTLMPYIVALAGVYKALPMIVLGILCITGGMAVLFLPETHRKHMPETVADVESSSTVGFQALKENISVCSRRIPKFEDPDVETMLDKGVS